MQRTKVKNVIAASLLLTLMAVMSFTGCSRSPVDPLTDYDSQPVVLSRISHSADGASKSPVNLYADTVISAQTGGQLTLLDVVLDVPAGAVDNDTLFSIRIPDDEQFYNEFGTEGLVFNVPVTVTMSYRGADLTGINESSIRVGYWNTTTQQWEDIECQVDHENKVVIAQLSHFSAYGLISDGPTGEM